MKRFFFLSTLFIVLVSVPIYAASKIFLPEWLKDEVISKLPLGTELSVGQVSSNYDLSILYEDVIYNSPGYKLEFNNFLIEPRINMASPLVAKADSARLITSANAIVFKKLEVKLVLSDIYFEDISLDGHISKIEGLNNSILNDATFLFEGLRKANKVLNLSAESLISDLQTPLGIVKLKLENFHTVASLNKKLDVSSAADFLDFAFIPKASDLTPKIISAHDLNFDFELVKTKNWDLPFKLSAKNFSSPSGHLVQSGEVMARGNWGNESTNCEIMAILSNQGSCGKIINIFDLSMDLQDPSGTIKFDGNGYCVAPKSGCPQRIDARIMSKSTANIFSQIMRSGLINPLVGGILIGGLLGSPVVENPNYDHSVDLSMRGSMILLNGKPLI